MGMAMEIKAIKELAKEIVYGERQSLPRTTESYGCKAVDECRENKARKEMPQGYGCPAVVRGLLSEYLSSAHLDWERFKSCCIYHELIPFLYIILKNNVFPAQREIFNFSKDLYYSGLLHYLILFQEVKNLIKEAKHNNILLIPIKGLSFSEQYYQRFGFRPLADIDVLIKEEMLEKGIALLESLGYQKELSQGKETYWRAQQCHLSFTKKQNNTPIIVELHWLLDFKRHKDNVIPQVWQRLKETVIEGEKFHLLSPEDTLFSLALHQRRFGKVFNLKYTCDTGILLDQETLDWDYLIKTAFEERIRASLYFLLYQTQFVLDINLDKYLRLLRLPFWQRSYISKITRKYIYSPPKNTNELKTAYILCHLVLYDNLSYPFKYILHIPEEQFAKFYQLPLYTPSAKKAYYLRIIYIPFIMLKNLIKKIFAIPTKMNR